MKNKYGISEGRTPVRMADWARGSSKWSPRSSAASRNARRTATAPRGRAPAFALSSPVCNSWHRAEPATVDAGIRPHAPAGRTAQLLLFPQRRFPSRDGEGPGGPERAGGVFDGLKILVVEDDFIVAFDMRMMLEEQGAQVLGPAAS